MSRKIIMGDEEAATLALQALVWILGDDDRAGRLLALTGLDAEHLREAAADPSTHSAILDYLMAYEPDLIACAETLNIAPEHFVMAQALLSGGHEWG